MKMRTIKLTPKFLLEALQGKTTSLISNLPEDAQLLDVRFDLCTNQVFLVVRSDSFEDIAELYPIPELKSVYKTVKSIPQIAPIAKAEPKPAIPKFLEPKAQIRTSQTTSNIEYEFSPDQRKLLSFKTEGERVIVKPTLFLKEEWNDINDVVKSLGGKWVKGDIINYWEIPLP